MFDPSHYVKAASAAKLARLSVPRIHQLRAAGTLPAVKTDAGFLFRAEDCLRLCRDRDRSRAISAVRRGQA